MQGSGRWGQVLNVEAPYLSRSQAFIFSLFSGKHGNGSSAGQSSGAVRCWQEHVGLCNIGGTSQLSLSEHVTLIGSVLPNSSG